MSMDLGLPIMLVLISITSTMLVLTEADIFNVLSYRAVGDGIADDTLAFTEAWNATCHSNKENPTMVIPKGKIFRVLPSHFSGPCISINTTVAIYGTILAPKEPDYWKGHDTGRWLAFKDINGLNVLGVGFINGNGETWWSISCRYNHSKECVTRAPTAISFTNCNNVKMRLMNVINSPQCHILVESTNNVAFDHLHINSPGDSPNTDGIHIHKSKNITIHAAIIRAGDDCISIGDFSSNISITYIKCGPGHGISIGSLGKDGNEVNVENIQVKNVHFNGTTNGARIKTWAVGKGNVRDITFLNLNFTNVENPIIIDQNYCSEGCRPSSPSPDMQGNAGVRISDVRYINTWGTSKTQVAINFNCSNTTPCTGIKLNNIQLKHYNEGKEVISSCNNAHGDASGVVYPKSCLDD